MTLPADLSSVVVTGTYLDPAGAGLPGTITFTPSGQLTDSTGATVIPAYGRTYRLGANGKFTTDALVATDNAGLTPANWTYQVSLSLQNLPTTTWNVAVSHAPFSFTATNATPCVFTAAGSAYANGTAVSLAGSSLPAGFTAGTTYFVVSASGTSFSLAATSGGSAIASTSTGSGTVSTAVLDISSLTPVFTQLAALSYAQLVLPTSVQSGTIAAAAGQLVLVTTASGNVTVNLPTGVETGSQVGVKMVILGAGNTATVTCTGSDKFNIAGGGTTLTLSLLNQGVALVYSGGQWVVEGDDLPLAQLDARYLPLLTQTPVKTANYTAAAAQLVRCDTSGGSFTVTLPTAPAGGTLCGVKQVAVAGAGTNALTVTCGGSDVLNVSGGSTSATMTLKGQSQVLEYNSGVWEVVATDDGATALANSRQGTWYLDSFTGTDDAKMTAALAAVIAAGGGTIQLSPRAHAFAGQWATVLTGTSVYVRIRGAGGGPATGDAFPVGPTVCNMTYAGGGAAKMDFHHNGTIAIEDIFFKDTSGSTVPFFQQTNTSPKLRRLAFAGSKTGTACNQDAIYFGGTNSAHNLTDSDDASFQGYMGIVEDVTFYGIRTGVWCRTFANSISMRDLSFDNTCGSANVFSVTDAAMTATSATLTCSTSTPFTSGMVGQVVLVAGAGQASRNGWLIATITAFTSSAAVTLSCAALATVSAAVACAPAGAAIQLGSSGAPGGVEGCVVDDCLIEVNSYPIGVLLNQSSGNAIIGTALWDGVTGVSLCGVGAVGTSVGNYVHLTEAGVGTGGAAFTSDQVSNSGGTDIVISPNGTNPAIQLPGLTISGSEQIKLFGNGATTGTAIGFGPPGGPSDTWWFRDTAGNLNGSLAASGSPLYRLLATTLGVQAGLLANYAYLGPLGTTDAWFTAGGSNANINVVFRAQGTGVVKSMTKLASGFAATPTISANAAAGSGATVSVSGNDQRGTITVTTGTGPTVGDLATITFTTTGGTWPNAPFVVVSGDSSAAAALMPGTSSRSATVFHLQCGSAPAASTAYTFNYICLA